jgi:Cu/Ag efflux pump CusA
LGAIAAAIGLIIDDAIVVVEQIHRTHEEHPELTNHLLGKGRLDYLFPAMVGHPSVPLSFLFLLY